MPERLKNVIEYCIGCELEFFSAFRSAVNIVLGNLACGKVSSPLHLKKSHFIFIMFTLKLLLFINFFSNYTGELAS